MQPTADEEKTWESVRIPRPVPGGSYFVESLGKRLDAFFGDKRAHAAAAALLEPLLMKQEEMAPDPAPVAIPEPVPGGTEPITRGADPNGDRR